MLNYIDDKEFVDEDFSQNPLAKANYEACEFIRCNFTQQDLSDCSFIECQFVQCDLSMVPLLETTFREVVFKECKLVGLHFEDCNPLIFSVAFETCMLNLSSFVGRKMPKTLFRKCQMLEVDFSEADLQQAVFEESNLDKALFEFSNLEKADFRTAQNYTIDPENNKLKKAQFSSSNLKGLLKKYGLNISD